MKYAGATNTNIYYNKKSFNPCWEGIPIRSDWKKKLAIAVGIGVGILYLTKGCNNYETITEKALTPAETLEVKKNQGLQNKLYENYEDITKKVYE